MWTNICTTGICLETFLSDAIKWDHLTGSLRHFCIISFSVSAIKRVPNGTMHTITMVKIPQLSFPFFWTIHILRQHIFRPFLTHPLLDTVQDFLIEVGIKSRVHLLEIGVLSLYNVILRPTTLTNRADKNWAHFL